MAIGAPFGGRKAGLTESCANATEANMATRKANIPKILFIIKEECLTYFNVPYPHCGCVRAKLFQVPTESAKRSPLAKPHSRCTTRPGCWPPRVPGKAKMTGRPKPRRETTGKRA